MARVPLITPLESGPNVAPAVPEEHAIWGLHHGEIPYFGFMLLDVAIACRSTVVQFSASCCLPSFYTCSGIQCIVFFETQICTWISETHSCKSSLGPWLWGLSSLPSYTWDNIYIYIYYIIYVYLCCTYAYCEVIYINHTHWPATDSRLKATMIHTHHQRSRIVWRVMSVITVLV